VLKIKWKSLVNILAGKEIYPELNGSRVTAENIDGIILSWDAKKIIYELKSAEKMWRKSDLSPMQIVAEALK
jgi:lipid A disaccharide synthetase